MATKMMLSIICLLSISIRSSEFIATQTHWYFNSRTEES